MKIKPSLLLKTILFIYFSYFSLFADNETKDFSLGIKFMFGGRYDNIRMCVASDTGVKGGIIADIMLVARFNLKKNSAIAFELPIMRPILFAFAFKMLQFEPEFTFEFKHKVSEKIELILGPALGLSLHYGPDYHSDKNNRGPSFFASGPFISSLFALRFKSSSYKAKMIGIRAFYAPLFSSKSELSPGTVIGGVVEGQFSFK